MPPSHCSLAKRSYVSSQKCWEARLIEKQDIFGYSERRAAKLPPPEVGAMDVCSKVVNTVAWEIRCGGALEVLLKRNETVFDATTVMTVPFEKHGFCWSVLV